MPAHCNRRHTTCDVHSGIDCRPEAGEVTKRGGNILKLKLMLPGNIVPIHQRENLTVLPLNQLSPIAPRYLVNCLTSQ